MPLNRSNFHDYQTAGVNFSTDIKKGALWLDMGFGKTVTTLTVIRDLLDSLEAEKVLIVAPLRVANTVWHTEINNWEHLRGLTYSICTGSAKQRIAGLHKRADIHIINRENIPWLVDYYANNWPFDTVVLDESSSFKSSKTKRWKSLRKANRKINRMIQLTGTPSPNGLLDLWAQVFLLDGGQRLGKTFGAFTGRFFESDYMGFNLTPRQGAEEKIKSLVADIVFSVDVPKHSERVDIYREAQLTPKQLADYRKFEQQSIIELQGEDITAMSAAALSNKLLQFANGNVYNEEGETVPVHSAKLDVLAEIVEEANEPLLIAYNYKSDLAALTKAYPSAVVLDKSMETIERWNNGEIDMLLAHPASAGHGLNLQKGSSLMVWYGLTWSLEYYQQFVARLDRQGQKKTVRNIHIITQDTIDKTVVKALANKSKVQDSLLEYVKEYTQKSPN